MKPLVLKSFISLFALAVWAGQASAQAAPESEAMAFGGEEICGMPADRWPTVIAPGLVGQWTSSNGPGTLTIKGRTVALPAQDETFVDTIFLVDGELAIDGHDGVYGMEFTQESLNEENVPDTTASLSDWASTAGCLDVNTLPRLHISGVNSEGAKFDTYLVVLDTNRMTGVVIGQKGGAIARRTVLMTR